MGRSSSRDCLARQLGHDRPPLTLHTSSSFQRHYNTLVSAMFSCRCETPGMISGAQVLRGAVRVDGIGDARRVRGRPRGTVAQEYEGALRAKESGMDRNGLHARLHGQGVFVCVFVRM